MLTCCHTRCVARDFKRLHARAPNRCKHPSHGADLPMHAAGAHGLTMVILPQTGMIAALLSADCTVARIFFRADDSGRARRLVALCAASLNKQAALVESSRLAGTS